MKKLIFLSLLIPLSLFAETTLEQGKYDPNCMLEKPYINFVGSRPHIQEACHSNISWTPLIPVYIVVIDWFPCQRLNDEGQLNLSREGITFYVSKKLEQIQDGQVYIQCTEPEQDKNTFEISINNPLIKLKRLTKNHYWLGLNQD